MAFMTDQQTLDDLGIFGRRGADSVYGIFNRTITRQGAALLEEMFRYPLADAKNIRQRSAIFQYFFGEGTVFPFRSELFDIAETYLSVTDERTRLSGDPKPLASRMASLIAEDNEYANIYKGVTALMVILQVLRKFVGVLSAAELLPGPYQEERAAIVMLLAERELQPFLAEDLKTKLSFTKVVGYDGLLRFRHRGSVRLLLQSIYRLDVYISVGRVAAEREFSFPVCLPPEQQRLSLAGVYHPLIKNAIANDLEITPEQHVVFLTGANMAGKSTFMKSLGITLFLAHMGFPVPARRMEFAVLDGIYTTINLPDNLGMGASHFYAEVLRVKKIAVALDQGRRLFVIFDELFRGTNVRDAYEATVALTSAFAHRSQSIFVISTHIIEAGEVLGQDGRVRPLFLPTRMEGNKPVYTYKLEEGITADRHGMVIINNEGIPDLLKGQSTAADTDSNASFADQQTLDDLNLTGKYRPGSIYSLFNRVQTAGGERLLEAMFNKPLTDPKEINRRVDRLRYLQHRRIAFPFTRRQLSQVEDYLHAGAGGNRLSTAVSLLRLKTQETVVKDHRYGLVVEGVMAMVAFIHDCRKFFRHFEGAANPCEAEVLQALMILEDTRLRALPVDRPKDQWGWRTVARYHHLFGKVMQEKMTSLCAILYGLDLGIAVGNVGREKGFTWARARPAEENIFHAADLWHPGLAKPIGNDLSFNGGSNVLFLTGANMAGKSTLMKGFGIAMYLAHMGFPVAAGKMEFSVKEGLFSSINVPDDLSLGYSHFYAEVLRVKKVAEAVSRGRDLVVIFDELFKGTNVKDAFDATLSVTEAFAGYRTCWFIISTHIIEVGESLRQKTRNLQFGYLPTVMDGTTPRYPYTMREGITNDRHGMLIIVNEGILALIQP